MKKSFAVILVLIMCFLVGCDSSDYKKAEKMFNNGSFELALEIFESLGDYEGSVSYIEKCKYPRWIQSPEWPISKSGKPMKFVKQITDKNTQITKFIFEDIDTKQETTIEQFT